ncbi:hypothetical protein D8682_25365 [Buttiauxella sp. 3AFRM03]|nr:hypothetical protein D8682_25365 [Buttiauxella sp. 3AFRM03]
MPGASESSILIGLNADGHGITASCFGEMVEVSYMKPDYESTVTGREKYHGNILIKVDNELIMTRRSVTISRPSATHLALTSKLNNAPATVRKVLRGIRDAKETVTLQATASDKIVNSADISAIGSTEAVTEFANKCGIEI